MARKPRLDAPGALHHVIARGIDGQRIFASNGDCFDFLRRIEDVARESKPMIYGWALMPNHFHLLIRTANTGLSAIMRRLMTGHAVTFNLRHGRSGHVFQNRYKSLLCQDEPYLLELVRYIHLNPLRSGLVSKLEDLDSYPWCGHSALMGSATHSWQEVDEILSRFGAKVRTARRGYYEFLKEGLTQGPDRTNRGDHGNGEWSRVLSRQPRIEKAVCDSRVLGSNEFVESVVEEAERQEKESLRLTRDRPGVDLLCQTLALGHGLQPDEVKCGAKRRDVVRARRDVIFIAMKKLGYSGAEVARHLGVSTSCVNRNIARCDLSPIGKKVIGLLE